ncbi:het-s domain protein [Colletotrichum karsti]|uniref:Het-s domain protein n=1 Tax=Colletotrichum karsti TaxID=1095194 RepID=A0A9P6HZS4_9PEZI|nr:het-s domain protein [Colletotrichum karsti]KAF9873155.1 het-s domain protein [Colletotrichum karsti]
MSVELVLAAVAAADLCLKYGKKLMSAYRDFKGASEAVQERLLIVEAMWSKTASQIEFARVVFKVLEEEHCGVYLRILETLHCKFSLAISKIESVTKTSAGSGVKKLKYVLSRDDIDDAVAQLQTWHTIFDPTWFLMLRIDNKLIDTELLKSPGIADAPITPSRRPSYVSSMHSTLVTARSIRDSLKGEGTAEPHVSLAEDGLDWSTTQAIEYSTTSLVRKTGSTKVFAIDTIDCTPKYDLQPLRTAVDSMAKKLKKNDINYFGLLTCKGVVKRKDSKTKRLISMNLIFQLPIPETGNVPVSLRSHLLKERTFSLSRVLDIANQLARAVIFIHTFDFVHKNIRPETILVFPDHSTKSELGSAFLVGFDSFRHVNLQTLKIGDKAWERNLYRHPSRQGIQAQEAYIMQHDVYSLGVCLLELGLWESFVDYQTQTDGSDQEKLPGAGLGIGLEGFAFESNDSGTSKIKDRLVELAKTRLPIRMGDRYAAVVVTCLTCLDPDNKEFGGEEMQDEDGILVGVRFIERVLLKLGDIVL